MQIVRANDYILHVFLTDDYDKILHCRVNTGTATFSNLVSSCPSRETRNKWWGEARSFCGVTNYSLPSADRRRSWMIERRIDLNTCHLSPLLIEREPWPDYSDHRASALPLHHLKEELAKRFERIFRSLVDASISTRPDLSDMPGFGTSRAPLKSKKPVEISLHNFCFFLPKMAV